MYIIIKINCRIIKKYNSNSNRKFLFLFYLISYYKSSDKLERFFRREISDPNFEAPSSPMLLLLSK